MRKTITSKLSWSTHIDNIISKANKMLGLLKRTFPLLQDIRIRWTLYLSLVKSQLSYGCEIWSPHEFGCKRMLESVQRRATGWILMCRQGYISYKNRLIKLNLLRLAYDREVRDLVFFFKSMHGFTDCNSYNYVSLVSHGRFLVDKYFLLLNSVFDTDLVCTWTLLPSCSCLKY